MAGNIITKMFGTKHERDVKKMLPLVDTINNYFEEYQKLSDADLKYKTEEFKNT